MTEPVRVSTSGTAPVSSVIGRTALLVLRARPGAAVEDRAAPGDALDDRPAAGQLLLPPGATRAGREDREHHLVALGQPVRDLRDVPGRLPGRHGDVDELAVGAG